MNACLLLSCALALAAPGQGVSRPGVLLLAHGGSSAWDANIDALAKDVGRDHLVEVALGMAARASIQEAVTRLEARGATEIVAVPLFISSHSSIVRSTEYLLGIRKDAPRELAIYAKMSHGPPAGGSHAGHAAPEDGTKPIVTKVPVRMTKALDDHPLLGAIAADRARTISRAPARESVILVVHGPVPDADNALWLRDLRAVATHLQGYASVDVASLRDDAPPPVRNAATAQLRAMVTKHRDAGREVLIVPVLLSFGGIEKGLRERLEGLDYRIPQQGIAPDARLAEWIRAITKS